MQVDDKTFWASDLGKDRARKMFLDWLGPLKCPHCGLPLRVSGCSKYIRMEAKVTAKCTRVGCVMDVTMICIQVPNYASEPGWKDCIDAYWGQH